MSHAHGMHCCHPSSSSWLHRRPTGACSIHGTSHVSYKPAAKRPAKDLPPSPSPPPHLPRPATPPPAQRRAAVGDGHEELRFHMPRLVPLKQTQAGHEPRRLGCDSRQQRRQAAAGGSPCARPPRWQLYPHRLLQTCRWVKRAGELAGGRKRCARAPEGLAAPAASELVL